MYVDARVLYGCDRDDGGRDDHVCVENCGNGDKGAYTQGSVGKLDEATSLPCLQ